MADRRTRTSFLSFLVLVSLALLFGQLPSTWAKSKAKQTADKKEASPVKLVGSVDFVAPLSGPTFQGDGLSLCYQVSGQSGAFYNLLYDNCLAINAEYYTSNIPGSQPSGTFVKKVGILAQKKGKKQRKQILIENTSECRVAVNGAEVDRKYREGDTSIAKSNNDITMILTTCGGEHVHIEAQCVVLMGVAVVKLSITSASQDEHFHGLMGQFINVPISFEPYRLADVEGMYKVTVSKAGSAPRVFLGQYYSRQWDGFNSPCLYVGSNNGGAYNYELEFEMGTSVIEGSYTDYNISHLFRTDFKFGDADPEPSVLSIPAVNDYLGGEGLVSVVFQTAPHPLSLCFQVDWETDTVYSLLSHDNLVMNARFVTAATESGLDQLAFLYRPISSESRRFFVESEGCRLIIDSVLTRESDISTDDYQIRRRGDIFEFFFKQVGSTQVKLWVQCAAEEGEELLSVKVDRTIPVPSSAKGLLGQFWGQSVTYKNIPPSDRKPGVSGDDPNLSQVLVSISDRKKPKNPKPRQFVADMLSWRWNGDMMSCLYVGNTQGGPSQWDTGNVIKGTSQHYVRQGMFDP